MRHSRNVLLILVLTVRLGAQSVAVHVEGRMPTLDEALRSHNIEPTASTLVNALKHADPEVRYLAAQKLAESKRTDAIPAIVEALASEKVPLTRVNVAYALAQLSDTRGFGALEDGCSKGRLDPQTSALSAQYLLDLHHEHLSCLNSVLEIVQSESVSSGYRMQAASVLARFHALSSVDSGRVLAGLMNALAASDATVRMAASDALADVGNSVAIPALQKTAANESDAVVRAHIERALVKLQAKRQP
jgi:HEAT repeat protein